MPGALPRPRHGAACLLAALGLSCAGPGAAAAGGFVVSGQSGSLYDGDELDELLRSVATVVYVLLIADDDGDGDLLCGDVRGHEHGYHHDHSYGCDDLGISVPQVQVSAGLGYALTRRLTVGARYLYRHDRRRNDIARLWGGGPEVSLDLRGHGAVRPFAGGYLLFTRGQRRADDIPLAHGISLGVRAGIRVRMAEGVHFVLQSGLQDDHFPGTALAGGSLLQGDDTLMSRGATLGLGLRVELP